MKKVSILGCGWLGLPLGKFLADKGYEVKGSTTDPSKLGELKKSGIESYLVKINPDVICENMSSFLDSDILFLNIPPERRDDIETYHRLQMENLVREVKKSPVKHLLFASSTSVYPNMNHSVDENCRLEPDKKSGLALLNVEKYLMEQNQFSTTVLRFAGLVGYERSPLRSIRRKKLVLNPGSRLNLIHRDDCVKISYLIMEKGIWGELFNACCDKHPERRDYYTSEAKKHGIQLPEFDNNSEGNYKVVDNSKLKRSLNYSFLNPDPLDMKDGYL